MNSTMFITWVDGDDRFGVNIDSLKIYKKESGSASILISDNPSQTVTPPAEAIAFVEAMLFDGSTIADLPVEVINWPGGVRVFRVTSNGCALVRILYSDLNDLTSGFNYPEGTTAEDTG